MPAELEKYEGVIGLEVHAQLLTRSKLFCSDSCFFGEKPNTQVGPVSLAHPGTLPVLNKEAIALAVKLGLVCHSRIERHNYFARKHYFYPDLPKGYQISQHTSPVCQGGFLKIRTTTGEKQVVLNRIHLEEDAGKSLHDLDPDYSCVDFNRAGVPLIEIVTEPCLANGEEAAAFLTEMRKILRYLGICDGNMEEGSMRCDANVSVKLPSDKVLGTKVEIKNLNSIRHVRLAIQAEIGRLIEEKEAGKIILQETRSYDAGHGTSFSLRTKEEADDYRYFADPDLPPFQLTDHFLETVRSGIPALPEELQEKYIRVLQLPEYDARILTDDKETADYFEQLILETTQYKSAANWLLGPVKSYLNEHGMGMDLFPLPPAGLMRLIRLVDQGRLSFSIASSRIFPQLLSQPGEDPLQLAQSMNLLQNSDKAEISALIDEILARMPEKVAEYKKGKKGLIGLFMGEVKKISKGKADPGLANSLLQEKLGNL